jgi:hypothetical protein
MSGSRVNVLDFDGVCQVEHADGLLARLRSVRRGSDGAFVLDHGGKESLWVHINGDAAFVWFCPDKEGRHPGFVPDKMWPGERRDIRFRLVSEFEGDSINMPWWQLVPVDVAYRAAVEFLNSPTLPPSVSWFEL